MSRAPKFIEQKTPGRGVYRAVVAVPKDLQDQFGGRKFLRKSLGIYDPAEAEHAAMPWVYHFKALFRQARGEAVGADPKVWQSRIAITAPGSEDRAGVDHAIVRAARDHAGVTTILNEDGRPEVFNRDSIEELREAATYVGPTAPQVEAVEDFTRKVMDTETGALVEEWLAVSGVALRTQRQMGKAVAILAERFPYLSQVIRRDVQVYVEEMVTTGQRRRSTVLGLKGNWVSYFKFLQRREVVSEAIAIPVDVTVPRETDAEQQAHAKHEWTPGQVVALWRAAEAKGDLDLADYILIAAYSGLRGAEIGQLRVEDIEGLGGNLPTLKVTRSKTKAGRRTVPVHSALVTLFTRRIGDRTEGYLIDYETGRTEDLRHTRVTRNFGNLKDAEGYSGAGQDFHSFRRTVATLLHNSEVEETVAAGILGHKIKTMSYGTYSGGLKVDILKRAIERVSYDFPEGAIR